MRLAHRPTENSARRARTAETRYGWRDGSGHQDPVRRDPARADRGWAFHRPPVSRSRRPVRPPWDGFLFEPEARFVRYGFGKLTDGSSGSPHVTIPRAAVPR